MIGPTEIIILLVYVGIPALLLYVIFRAVKKSGEKKQAQQEQPDKQP